MDVDPNSKKRKREDGVGTSEVEGEVPGQVVSAVPVKKVLDIAAMKAKLAEGKKKVEEMKKTAPVETPEAAPQIVLPSANMAVGEVQRTAPTISANARFLKEQEDKRKREQKKEAKVKEEKPFDPSFDPRIKRISTERQARPLKFLQVGELKKKAEVQGEKITKLMESKLAAAEQLPPPRRPKPSMANVTEVEWWDKPYYVELLADSDPSLRKETSMEVSEENSSFDSRALREDLITLLIHHPVMTKALAEPPPMAPQPLMLTPKETERLRKRRRAMELEQRREEVVLGIRPADKGKMKLATMVKTQGDAVTDPTLVEKRVLEERALREGRHNARNQERKLTPEQRKEKEIAKLKEDTSLSSHVAVFRILTLANGKIRFKLDKITKSNFLSGVAVYSRDFVVLAVEGGPKAIARFTKKMLHKIPWKQAIVPTSNDAQVKEDNLDDQKPAVPGATPSSTSTTTDATTTSRADRIYGKAIEPEQNECHLVWQGEVLRRAFQDFRFVTPKALDSRSYLDSLGVAHYYDSAKSYVPPDVVLN